VVDEALTSEAGPSVRNGSAYKSHQSPLSFIAAGLFVLYEKRASWLKIRNTSYRNGKDAKNFSSASGDTDPDLSLLDDCVRACQEITA